MSISNKDRKRARQYTALSILTLVFSLIYEFFSFGVWSLSMVLAFLVPLLGGALPSWWLSRHPSIEVPTMAFQAWGASLAWTTVGMLIQGIIEIYGTTNALIPIYGVIAALLALAALLLIAHSHFKRQKNCE